MSNPKRFIVPVRMTTVYEPDANEANGFRANRQLVAKNGYVLFQDLPLGWGQFLQAAINSYNGEELQFYDKNRKVISIGTLAHIVLPGEPLYRDMSREVRKDKRGEFKQTFSYKYLKRMEEYTKDRVNILGDYIDAVPLREPCHVVMRFKLTGTGMPKMLHEYILYGIDCLKKLGVFDTLNNNRIACLDESRIEYGFKSCSTDIRILRYVGGEK